MFVKSGIVVKEKMNMGLDWKENGTAKFYSYKGKSLNAESLKMYF